MRSPSAREAFARYFAETTPEVTEHLNTDKVQKGNSDIPPPEWVPTQVEPGTTPLPIYPQPSDIPAPPRTARLALPGQAHVGPANVGQQAKAQRWRMCLHRSNQAQVLVDRHLTAIHYIANVRLQGRACCQ